MNEEALVIFRAGFTVYLDWVRCMVNIYHLAIIGKVKMVEVIHLCPAANSAPFVIESADLSERATGIAANEENFGTDGIPYLEDFRRKQWRVND